MFEDTLLTSFNTRFSLGPWSGFCGEGDVYPSQSMISFNLHASLTSATSFQSSGITPDRTEWNLTGEYIVSDEAQVHYTFNIVYAHLFIPQYFSGKLDESGTMLSGTWVQP